MKIFNSIKKSRRESSDIDEKIEYLNKECKKTGLQEYMTTTGMYFSTGEEPNPDHSTFTNASFNGKGFGMTSFNGLSIGGSTTDQNGFSFAPDGSGPATSYLGLASQFGPAVPGSQRSPQHRKIGAFLWYWNGSSYSRLEWKFDNQNVSNAGQWAQWKQGAYNPFLDPIIGDASFDSNLLTAILASGGGGAFPDPDNITPPTNPIVFKNDLGDPDFLPINIPGLSGYGYEWLKNKAEEFAKKYNRKYQGANDPFWDDFVDSFPDIPAGDEDPNTRKGTGMDDRWIGPPIEKVDVGNDNKTEIALPPAAILAAMMALGIAFKGAESAWKMYRKYKQQIDQKIKEMKAEQGQTASYEPEGDLLSEAAKLGHFDPEILNVDINDIRKGIMPEFPKDPPPEMVNGYNPNSRLAPKEIDPVPYIKITRKDLAQNHKLTDKEITEFMNDIKMINDYIKKNPADLIYAQTRYPKDDPRLAQLNWKMDQMMQAGKDYMDKTFPENEKLFKKVQKSIKKNIELTDPKSFKDVEVPKFEGVNLTDYKRRKEVVSRHFKKAVKIQKLFSNKKRRNNIKEQIESKKINIQEIMTTSNMYFSGEKVPNQDYNDFEGTSEGGYGLGLSGADGNNVGNADVGSYLGQDGVALSPPHPVTGVRINAVHVRDGLGGTQALRPGAVIKRGFADNAPDYTMGSALWFFDPDYNNGVGQPAGKWCNFEWGNFENNTGWGFWDTVKTGQFAGLWIFNRNLGEHPCAGGDLASKISGLNFSLNGAVGAPQTTVLFKNDLGDPDHLPINIPGLSPEAFNYLFAGANYDMYNWILKTYGMPAAEWYLKTGKTGGNPYVPYGSYFPKASNPYTGAQDGDMFAFFGGNKGNQGFDPTKKQNRATTFNLINAVNSGDPSYLPPGVTMDQARQWVDNYNNGNLSEAVKLGHFEPEQLNVNIEDLRKGIMPEFPKDPPPEMIDGYAANSRLAPKQLDPSPYIKITKKDLAQNHKLKDSEIKDFMNKINAVNDFIKKHPEELVYAQTRYPKDDPRLAQLNWEMDQRLNASKEFMNKHYPENQKLFTKIQKTIKKNIELTDPKTFKGVKIPKFEGVDLTDYKRRKELVSRHFKKAIRTKKKT